MPDAGVVLAGQMRAHAASHPFLIVQGFDKYNGGGL
jgi:hypothetical protein